MSGPPAWDGAYAPTPVEGFACSTCGDVAVVCKVVEVRGHEAVVEDGEGRQTTVAVDFVPDVGPGELLLVHAGIAIGRALQAGGQP